jgi:L-ascorbate oxidase
VSMKLEEHDMTVIAADVRYTKPQPIDHLQIGTGQRFDVVIQAKTPEQLSQLNRSSFFMKMQTKERPTVYTGYALFRYNSSDTILHTPTTVAWNSPNDTYNFLEYTLEPLTPNDFPSASEVTRRLTMSVSQRGSSTGYIHWYENNLNWTERREPRPLLPDVYLYGESAIPNYTLALENGGWDPVFKAWPAKIGEVLELIIENTGSLVGNAGGLDVHPFHAHAGHYYDIGRGFGTYNAAENEKRLAGYSPVTRDTTYLYRYSSSTTAGARAAWRGWRIRVADAGVYLIHCHILQHMIMGMLANVFCFIFSPLIHG